MLSPSTTKNLLKKMTQFEAHSNMKLTLTNEDGVYVYMGKTWLFRSTQEKSWIKRTYRANNCTLVSPRQPRTKCNYTKAIKSGIPFPPLPLMFGFPFSIPLVPLMFRCNQIGFLGHIHGIESGVRRHCAVSIDRLTVLAIWIEAVLTDRSNYAERSVACSL